MSDLFEMITNIKDAQDTIDVLLDSGKLLVKRDDISPTSEQWYIEGLYNDDECNIGFGHFPGTPNAETSSSIPHVHKNNKEFFILIKGMTALFINGKYTRTLKVGDVGIVNPNELHSMVPLVKDTKLIYICVPADKTYTKLFNKNE